MAAKKSDKKTTVTRIDQYGNKVEVPVGIDGVNPISTWNPAEKAVDAAHRDDYPVAAEDLPQASGEPKAKSTPDTEDSKDDKPEAAAQAEAEKSQKSANTKSAK